MGLVLSVPPQLHRASLRRSFRPQSGQRRQCGHGRSATSSTAHSQEGHQIWDVEAVDIAVFRPTNGCLQQIAANRLTIPQDVAAILLEGFVLSAFHDSEHADK